MHFRLKISISFEGRVHFLISSPWSLMLNYSAIDFQSFKIFDRFSRGPRNRWDAQPRAPARSLTLNPSCPKWKDQNWDKYRKRSLWTFGACEFRFLHLVLFLCLAMKVIFSFCCFHFPIFEIQIFALANQLFPLSRFDPRIWILGRGNFIGL